MATAINQTNAIRQSYEPVTVSSCTHYWAALCSRCQGSHDLHLPWRGSGCSRLSGHAKSAARSPATAKPDRF